MRLLTAFVALCVFGHGVPAQVVPIPEIEKQLPEDKFQSKADDKGVQVLEAVHQNCPTCKGSKLSECQSCRSEDDPKRCPECKLEHKGKKRLATCYQCGGTGALPNPLELSVCPGCMGHSMVMCLMCGGDGEVVWVGSGGSGQKCTSCKGAGALVCEVCHGKRLVPAAFGGSKNLAKQNLKKLLGAKEVLDQLIKDVDGFRLTGEKNFRKDEKRLAGFFNKAKTSFPSLKAMPKHVKDLFKTVNRPNVKDIERRQQYLAERLRYYILNHLLHQKRLLAACIKRAEQNEKAEKK